MSGPPTSTDEHAGNRGVPRVPRGTPSVGGCGGPCRGPPRRQMSVVLEAHDLHTAYGLSRVLFGVSLEVAAGECVCLLGRNGVGKTTTMRSIMGLTMPARGRITWRGADITGWPAHRVAQAGLGFVPEDRRIFADLTVWENLDVAA